MGIRKHSGIATWILAFSYICGLIANVGSANKNAQYASDAPMLKQILNGNPITQSAFSRFLSKPFQWLDFSSGRLARLQECPESCLTDGDVIGLDDTKLEHPHGKKFPFLCWLFDSSDKRNVWCMNLVSTIAVLKNSLEYPMLWRFWVKQTEKKESQKQTKLELAKQMLTDFRSHNQAQVWVAMDRWFLYKHFFIWLSEHKFDWVTKAKRNTVLYRKKYDPVLKKNTYEKLNPKTILREVYPKLRVMGKNTVLNIPNMYIKMPYETKTRKGKPITRQQYVPIAAVAATYSKSVNLENVLLPEEEAAATFRDAYLLINNRVDAPNEVANAYAKRWRIEVFYRTAKQDLGLTSCYARSENAHFAHVELLFTAKTLLCYALWKVKNKEGEEQAPTISEMVRYFFNANCRICCYQQHIQVYLDTTAQRYSSIFETFWTNTWDFNLWYWDCYPETA